jgi:hypothetical protein
MQFVNIVVHSVEDMNFRVHLQYEFTKLGRDDYLEKLRHTESEELQVRNLLYEYVLIIIPLYEIGSHSVNVLVVLIHSIPFFSMYVTHSSNFLFALKIICLYKSSLNHIFIVCFRLGIMFSNTLNSKHVFI